MFETRNTAKGFAQRTRKNLQLVRQAREKTPMDYDFHVVTHLVNSLLGLVVVPQERHHKDPLWDVELTDLEEQGWPKWRILKDQLGTANPKTWTKMTSLGRLTNHLRNAAAHGRFEFTDEPDSRHLSRVTLIVKDAPGPNQPINWRAEISCEDLYLFCLLLAKRIDKYLN